MRPRLSVVHRRAVPYAMDSACSVNKASGPRRITDTMQRLGETYSGIFQKYEDIMDRTFRDVLTFMLNEYGVRGDSFMENNRTLAGCCTSAVALFVLQLISIGEDPERFMLWTENMMSEHGRDFGLCGHG